MIWLRRLMAGCWWDHEYVKELHKGKLSFRCQQCGAGYVVLPKQKLKLRKPSKVLRIAVERKRA